MIKVAVLDDYQSVFEEIIDIEKFKNKFDFKIFNEAFNDENEAIEALEEFEVLFICMCDCKLNYSSASTACLHASRALTRRRYIFHHGIHLSGQIHSAGAGAISRPCA